MSEVTPAVAELSGGALIFAAIMGTALLICIVASIYTCLKRREEARRKLEDAIEYDTYYNETPVTSIQSPPPPKRTEIVPSGSIQNDNNNVSKGHNKSSDLEVKADEPNRNRSRSKRSKRRKSSDNREGTPSSSNKRRGSKSKSRSRSKNGNYGKNGKNSKNSKNSKKGPRDGPLPGRQKIKWSHAEEQQKKAEDEKAAKAEEALLGHQLGSFESTNTGVQQEEDNQDNEETITDTSTKSKKSKKSKKEKKKSKKKKSKKKKSKKRGRRSDDYISSVAEEDVQEEDIPEDDITEENKEIVPTGETIVTIPPPAPPPISKPSSKTAISTTTTTNKSNSPPRRPGGAMLGSLPPLSLAKRNQQQELLRTLQPPEPLPLPSQQIPSTSLNSTKEENVVEIEKQTSHRIEAEVVLESEVEEEEEVEKQEVIAVAKETAAKDDDDDDDEEEDEDEDLDSEFSTGDEVEEEDEDEEEEEEEQENKDTLIDIAPPQQKQNEQLRRWSVSWQFIAGPDAENDDIHGPIKLNYMNRIVSIGSGKDTSRDQDVTDVMIVISNDNDVQEEHGMISYREDRLLYVNSSGAPTQIDDKNVTGDGGPTELRNGAVLALGSTKLVLSSYMEFAEQ